MKSQDKVGTKGISRPEEGGREGEMERRREGGKDRGEEKEEVSIHS